MADSKNNSARQMWMLGLALTLPMILLCGPLAGYLIASALVKKLGFPSPTVPILMSVGFLGSALQAYQLIQKLNQTTQKIKDQSHGS